MSFDEDQSLELLEDENDDDQDESFLDDEEDSEESDAPKRGNIAKALQQERQQHRETKAKIQDLEEKLSRHNALFERLNNQAYQTSQASDPVSERERLQDFMLQQPDEYTRWVANQSIQANYHMMAPIMASHAKTMLSTHPEYADYYKIPSIQKGIDFYIDSELEQGRPIEIPKIMEAMSFFAGIHKEGVKSARGGTGKDPAKERLSSVVGKGGKGAQRGELTHEYMMELRSKNFKKYMELLKSPQGKQLVNNTLKGE